jgi:hypothetical protein
METAARILRFRARYSPGHGSRGWIGLRLQIKKSERLSCFRKSLISNDDFYKRNSISATDGPRNFLEMQALWRWREKGILRTDMSLDYKEGISSRSGNASAFQAAHCPCYRLSQEWMPVGTISTWSE